MRGESSDAAPGFQGCVQAAGNGNLQLSSSKSSWFDKLLIINIAGSLYVISQNSVYENSVYEKNLQYKFILAIHQPV